MQYFNESVAQEIVKHLIPRDQVRVAIAMGSQGDVSKTFGLGVFNVVKMISQGGMSSLDKPYTPLEVRQAFRDGQKTTSDAKALIEAGGRALEEYALTGKVNKEAMPSAGTVNNPALFYPTQTAGVVLPPTTTPIITVLAQMGALQAKPNTRVLTQSALLVASEIAQGAPYPGAQPDVDFSLTDVRKFGLLVAFYNTLLAADNFSDAVLTYVNDQLETAANLATDEFMVALMTGGGNASTAKANDVDGSIGAAMANFAGGDLRRAVWIADPGTLATLQTPTNPNVGPRGGVFKTLPVIPSLTVPANTLLLIDPTRTSVFDGPLVIDRSTQASVVLDTDPASAAAANPLAAVSTFQNDMTALRVTKWADAQLLAKPTVIALT